ncbi:MAG: hypothetical protein E6Q97_22730 [Desulfurellales bacterium]|nr:MAG: hypothetical protein E6Q97_22730 [Desulfurellales bacterium]
MAGNWFSNTISNIGQWANAPVIFDWDTDAAQRDALNGTKAAFSDNAKRSLSSAAATAPNSLVQKQLAQDSYFTNLRSPGGYDTGAIDQNSIYGGTGGTGGRASAPSYNPADIAYLDDQRGRLEGQHRSADTALTNGLTQLQDSYNKEVSGANSRRAQAIQDLNTKRKDTTQAKNSALNRVNENARTLAEGLRRRIGMASGSNSSAFQITAPGAVSRNATEDRTGVLENFGVNFRDLATAEQRQKTQFEELLSDLEAQRKTRESDFRSGILEKKNQIDNSLSEVARQKALALGGGYNQVRAAMSPYASAIDSRQAEIDNLFNKFRTPFAQKAVDTTAPTLRDYMVDRANIKAGQPGPQDPTAPYKNPFGIKEEDQPVALY